MNRRRLYIASWAGLGMVLSAVFYSSWIYFSPPPPRSTDHTKLLWPMVKANEAWPTNVKRQPIATKLPSTARTVLLVKPGEVRYHALFTPNDPQYSLQWNIGAVNVPAAWDVDQTPPLYGGDPKVIVAVLDTGLASTKVGATKSVPDIAAGTVWTNTKEIPGDGIDNDGDGYVDDVHGWNFVADNASPADDNGHGTHISGIIADGLNNNIATAGIASNVTIMPLKVLDTNGDGSTATLTAALNYAVAHGATIVNLSLGGNEDDPVFHQAIQNAVLQGVVIIGAAGNSGATAVTYPARYQEVVSVSATTVDNSKPGYANSGPTLDLVAPGGDTNADLNGDGQPDGVPAQSCTDAACDTFAIMYYAGTSQAAAQVSGVAALMASCGAAPGNIKTLLTSTAKDLGSPGRDDQFGYGLVDAGAAMSAAGCRASAPVTPGPITGAASRTVKTALITDQPLSYTKPYFQWSGPAGATYEVTWKLGRQVVVQKKQASTNYRPTVSLDGAYTLSVVTVDALGRRSAVSTFVYRYRAPVVVVSAGASLGLYSSKLEFIRSIKPKIFAANVTVAGGALATDLSNRLLIAAQPSGPTVYLTDTAGKVLTTVQPFGPKFSGTIYTAVLQQASGKFQFVAATNTGGASIAWYTPGGKLLGRNLVFGKYTAGVNIAAGDVDGDGDDELIVAQTAGPAIRVYDHQRQRLVDFLPRGKTFNQGWSISAGDVNGDGHAEIIATPNVAAPTAKVLVLDGRGRELNHWTLSGSRTSSLRLQTADLNGDGVDEILVAQQGGAGALRQFSAIGKLLKQIKLATTAWRALTRL